MKKLALLALVAAASPTFAGTGYEFRYAPKDVWPAAAEGVAPLIAIGTGVVQPTAPTTPTTPTTPPQSTPGKKVFGSPDSGWWWELGGGVASSLGRDTDFNLRALASTFIAQNIQIGGELGLWYFGQQGKDRVGINPNFVFRWHFYNDNDWTVFLDTGVGFALLSGQVPQGGTKFNLTPRVGIGITKAIGSGNTRIEAGLRWHHLSNARIYGDGRNPSRDLPMLHVGIIFPF